MPLDKLHEWCLRSYGEEFTRFLETDFSQSPTCPFCGEETLHKLWLGDSKNQVDGRVWGKWYRWCESCLKGIYCPLGSYRIPPGTPFIPWGDEAALKNALPAELQFIQPVPFQPQPEPQDSKD